MKTYSILAILALSIFIGCGPKEKSIVIDDYQWLQGSWIDQDSTGIETWALQNGELAGNNFSSQENKIMETMRIYNDADGVHYEATVASEDNGKTLSFKLMYNSPDSLHFYNNVPEFPNHIMYKKLTDTTLQLTIKDNNDKGKSYQVYRMK